MSPEGSSLGQQLLDKGWRQGCLLDAVPIATINKLTAGNPPVWQAEPRQLDGSLVVATQTCDLVRDPKREPFVEFVRAFWTADKQTISEAKKNSIRHFLLRTETRGGVNYGLVADASVRMFVEKESLLNGTPLQGCDEADTEQRFQEWLAHRYHRPAVPEPLVRAVHKPVVDGLRAERKAKSKVCTLIEGVAEIRYSLDEDGGPPFQVAVFFVPEDGTRHAPITEAEAEELGAWFIRTIAGSGDARVARWDLWPLDEVSAADYFASTPLALDEFSHQVA